MVSVRQLVVVVSALSLQAVHGISMLKLDSLGHLYERSAEGDVSLMVDVVDVLHHSGKSRFVSSADKKLIEGKVKKLMWMAQCLKHARRQEQHTNDAHSKMTKKLALLDSLSNVDQANDVLLDIWRLSHHGHMIGAPKYPYEPLLDDDFIVDADNYLEDFINASDITKKLKDSYSTTSTTTDATSGLKSNASAKNTSAQAAANKTNHTKAEAADVKVKPAKATVEVKTTTTAAKTTAEVKATTTAAKTTADVKATTTAAKTKAEVKATTTAAKTTAEVKATTTTAAKTTADVKATTTAAKTTAEVKATTNAAKTTAEVKATTTAAKTTADVKTTTNAAKTTADVKATTTAAKTTADVRATTTAAKTTSMATTTAKKMMLLGAGNGCTTRADPRSDQRWQFLFGLNTAAPGTSCIFGVVPADEGSHCMLSDGKYGSFGWCYTRSDRTEWGSCGEGCPLVGTADVITKRLDRLTFRVALALKKLGITKCSKTHMS